MNDDVPTVGDVFGERCKSEKWTALCRQLDLSDINDKRLNYLSSGELRKLLLVNAISDSPDMLILDNPYIGLDAPSRESLNNAIESLGKSGLPIMLLLANADEIPDFASCIIPMLDLRIMPAKYVADANEVQSIKTEINGMMKSHIDQDNVPRRRRVHKDFETAVEMKSCSVKYGQREIISNETWVVKKGNDGD